MNPQRDGCTLEISSNAKYGGKTGETSSNIDEDGRYWRRETKLSETLTRSHEEQVDLDVDVDEDVDEDSDDDADDVDVDGKRR